MLSNTKLVPLFHSNSPQTVKYALQPPRVNPAYTEIPTAKFAANEKFEWVDGLVGDPALLKAIQQDSKYKKNILPELETCLNFPLNSLIICETGEKSGKGVFLSLDAKPIPTGTVMGVYAGHLYDALTDRQGDDSHYRAAATADEHQHSIAREILKSPSVDARKFGNITRYFQDLPDLPTLSQNNITTKDGATSAAFQKNARNNIATANLFIWPCVYRGVPLSFMVTLTDVQPGDQLGWNYEGNFTFAKKYVFNNDGKIIGHYSNESTILIDNVNNLKTATDKPPLNPVKLKQVIESFTKDVVNEKDVKTSGNGSTLSLLFHPTDKKLPREIQAQLTALKSSSNYSI